MDLTPPAHIPVLLKETIEALAVQPGGRYVDGTIGTGGHATAILSHSAPGGQLLGIDADPQTIEAAKARLQAYRGSCLLVNDNFANLEAVCIRYDFFPVHGILFDLGVSSLQLEAGERGFSFQHDGPLDMRFSPSQKITAADIVNTFSESELTHLIRTYGEERYCRRIAHHIVLARPVRTTIELARIVERALGGKRDRIHPATKTFQALRIVVNHELESLETALKSAIKLLGFQGRLVVISYHSLEDRIVKRFMQQESRDCLCPPGTPTCVCRHTARLRLINKKVVIPSSAEVQLNPRSRSARLRAAECIITQDEYYNAINAIEESSFSIRFKANGWRRPALLRKLRLTFAAVST